MIRTLRPSRALHRRVAPATLVAAALLAALVTTLVAALSAPTTAVADDERPTVHDTGTMPIFEVSKVVGRQSVSSEQWLGQPMLLDFWATWCAPCHFTLPALEQLHQDYSEHGLQVIGISIDGGFGGGARAKTWADKRGVTYPVYQDFKAEARASMVVQTVPVLFLLDAEGKLVADWYGEPDFDEVRGAIDSLLGIEGEEDSEAAP